MTELFISLALLLFALLFVAAVLLVIVGFFAGNVLRLAGTTSAFEWLSVVLLKVLAGNLRHRVRSKINRERRIGVDGSPAAERYILVLVSPADVLALTGPAGDLAGVEAEAVKGYVLHARRMGWAVDATPQVVVVPDEARRRGFFVVKAVSQKLLDEARAGMDPWDAFNQDDVDAAGPSWAPTTRLDVDSARTAPISVPDVATVAASSVAVETRPVALARVVLSDVHGRKHAITSGSALIGRGPECEVHLPDSNEVSREHLDIYLQEGTWWLRDRGSRNGTTVDGRPARGGGPVPLSQGSRILLGSESHGEQLTIVELDAR